MDFDETDFFTGGSIIMDYELFSILARSDGLKLICIKGAVCKFLTLLKHKNTIICLQIFKKHAKLTYLFI